MTTGKEKSLDAIDHVAISVNDIGAAVAWYTKQFSCTVDYQDESWAFLNFDNIRLALVIPSQHPAHLAFKVSDAEQYGPLETHRDGSRSVYVKDPAGNAVELLDRHSMTADKVRP
ncbi:MAG: VOC family protein [Candidatus Melainabacteria bacterium]|nr:MAG: VOC family protein [Candidatus Melainabacteria bacterium]